MFKGSVGISSDLHIVEKYKPIKVTVFKHCGFFLFVLEVFSNVMFGDFY